METEYEENLFIGKENTWERILNIYIGLMTIKTLDLINSVTTIKDNLEMEIVSQNGAMDAGVYIDLFKRDIIEVYKRLGLVIDETAPLSVFEAIVDIVKVLEDTDKPFLHVIENIQGSDLSMEENLLLLIDDLLPGKYDEMELLDNIDISGLFFDNIVFVIYNNKMSKTPPNPNLLNKICALSLKIPEVTNTSIFKSIISGELIEEFDLTSFSNVEYAISTLDTSLDIYAFICVNSTPDIEPANYMKEHSLFELTETELINNYEELRNS